MGNKARLLFAWLSEAWPSFMNPPFIPSIDSRPYTLRIVDEHGSENNDDEQFHLPYKFLLFKKRYSICHFILIK